MQNLTGRANVESLAMTKIYQFFHLKILFLAKYYYYYGRNIITQFIVKLLNTKNESLFE